MQENNIKKLIEIEVKRQLQLRESFTARKLVDTPTDNLQATPRKYVNMNGAVGSRPNSSIATLGQRYFATDTNIPMTYSSGGWRNGVGSIVAQIT